MIRSRKRGRGFYSFFSKTAAALLIVAVGFLAYKVYAVSYQKYQINKQISNLDDQLRALAQKSEGLKTLVTRLQDKDVIEKEARKKLNFVKEGEKAVIITSGAPQTKNGAAIPAKNIASPNWISNSKKWFDVLFGN